MANCSCTVDCGREDGVYLCGTFTPGFGAVDDGGGINSLSIVRSSGANGICDTIYGKAFFGAVACKNNKPVLMPFDIPQSAYMDLAITPFGGNCEDYSNEFGSGFTVTGVPITYDDFSQKFTARFSSTICGIGTTGCCYNVDDPSFTEQTCYLIEASLKGGPCVSKLDFLSTFQKTLVCDSRQKEVCEEVFNEEDLRLDPFADDGVNVNVWIIAKEAADTQKTIPIQTGVSHDDSYIGLIR